MIRLLTAAALCLAPMFGLFAVPAAQADAEPPRYDTDGLCFRQASTADGVSGDSIAQCLAKQDEAFGVVRRAWDGTPGYIQDDCDVRTRATGNPDYTALENCIAEQLRETLAPDATIGAVPSPPGN